jgi:peptidoglycan hydrolase-like protein with peptidoglycan-binding domain
LPAYPELDPGDRSPAVRTLQCAINDLGLGPVVVDGYYGPQTKKALTPVVNGREGQPPHPYRLYPLFWSQLYGLQIPEDTVLRQGDHGRVVRLLQRSLRAYGITVVVDGDFGPQTKTAVQAYQRHHGDTSPNGVVDEDVMFYLHGGDYY